MPMYKIKAKAEFEVVIEAENKAEANAWGEQVLRDIIKIDYEHSEQLVLTKKDIKVSKAKIVKEGEEVELEDGRK